MCERVENDQPSREEKTRGECGGGQERLWELVLVCCWSFSHPDTSTRLTMSPSSGAGQNAPPPLVTSGLIHPAES